MSPLRIAPIVEGHGEEKAVPILLDRICTGLLGATAGTIQVMRPFRKPRSMLLKKDILSNTVQAVYLKMKHNPFNGNNLILLLFDADDDCPARLAPRLLADMQVVPKNYATGCVLAYREYETWFVAAAESLGHYLTLGDSIPIQPEKTASRKKWIEKRFKRGHGTYSETLHQASMTASMDIHACQARSPSFDKLCRELARCLGASRSESSMSVPNSGRA